MGNALWKLLSEISQWGCQKMSVLHNTYVDMTISPQPQFWKYYKSSIFKQDLPGPAVRKILFYLFIAESLTNIRLPQGC